MPTNRPVSREQEATEFRPVPGFEEDWAGYQYVELSRLWDVLGLYPIGLILAGFMCLLGVVLCG